MCRPSFANQAVPSIDKALASAENGAHKGALTEARTVLVAYLRLDGFKKEAGRDRRGLYRRGVSTIPRARR